MGNPIEQAREALQQGLKQLPGVGLRKDYTLTLRRYPQANPAATELDMDPDATEAARGAPETLAIEAPNVTPLDTLSAAAAQAIAGGLVQAGDLLVKLVRTAEVEAFLKAAAPGTPGGPYPEIARVEFVINGEVYRAVYTRPKAMTSAFTVRRQAAS